MTSRLVAVAIDCRDPEALAAFWCAALDYRVRERWADAAGTGYVETGDGDGAVLLFQPVHEDKAVKNRLHLDIAPTQGSQADEIARLVGLGASVLVDDSTLPWAVLAGPEETSSACCPRVRSATGRPRFCRFRWLPCSHFHRSTGADMSLVTGNQPDGTPTWIDLGIPDLDRAMEFYRALFGWEFDVGPAETGHYTMCLLLGRPVAALMPNHDSGATEFWWNIYLATADCDRTAARIVDAGGTLLAAPMDVMDKGRMAIAQDPLGAQFGLWQGRAHIGCEVVNEPNSLVRNDLITPNPGPARDFYASVFDFTLDRNEDLPDLDFTFLRRPDGHEVAGILGAPDAAGSAWGTTFEVADTDAVVQRATAAGGTSGEPEDMVYGRFATITDPFGVEFSVITRPPETS